MKKILSIFLCFVMSLCCFSAFGCKSNKDSNEINLSEVTHSTFYAPLYIAINNGYFKDEGLKIKLTSGEGADKVMSAITSKSVDIGLGGPEAVVYCYVNGQKDHPVVFGQLTKRDGSFLVSKKPASEFDWSDLKGKRLLAGRKGGVPAMTLQYVLNAHSIGLSDLNFDTSVSFANMAGVFEADKTVDYTTLFEPTASQVEKAGKGYIVTSIGLESGEIPYTAFCASKSYISSHKKQLSGFLRALKRGYEFIKNNDLTVVAQALAPSFEGFDPSALADTVKSYVNVDAWSETPVMKKEAFERLQDVMQNAGELKTRAPFEKIVDNSLALALNTNE